MPGHSRAPVSHRHGLEQVLSDCLFFRGVFRHDEDGEGFVFQEIVDPERGREPDISLIKGKGKGIL